MVHMRSVVDLQPKVYSGSHNKGGRTKTVGEWRDQGLGEYRKESRKS